MLRQTHDFKQHRCFSTMKQWKIKKYNFRIFVIKNFYDLLTCNRESGTPAIDTAPPAGQITDFTAQVALIILSQTRQMYLNVS